MPWLGRGGLTIGLVGFATCLAGCGSSGVRAVGDLAEESPVPIDSYVVPTKEPLAEPSSRPGGRSGSPGPRGFVAPEPSPRGSEDRSVARGGAVARPSVSRSPRPASQAEAVARQAEDEAVRLTNLARARAGCGPLRTEERLRRAARAHSADMAARGYFDHESLDGRSPWDRIKATGYAFPAAENIARGQRTARAVVDAWLDSPGHRANILNCDLAAVAVGVRFGAAGPWWTQNFGSR